MLGSTANGCEPFFSLFSLALPGMNEFGRSLEGKWEREEREKKKEQLSEILKQLRLDHDAEYKSNDHPHSKLSSKALQKLIIITKDTTRIDGLPLDITKETLTSQNWETVAMN